MSDALFAAFDKEGKYLYFTASTDVGLNTGWLDMSSMNRPVTRSVYVAVLSKALPSPLAPESDEEKPPEGDTGKKPESADKAKNKDKEPEPARVSIDFDNISQRILALPIPACNYQALAAGKTGVVFLVESPPVHLVQGDEEAPALTVHKFDLKTRKTEKLLEDVNDFELSFNGEKMLFRRKDQWTVAPAEKPAEGPAKPGEGGPLKLDSMQAYVDPRAEWKHMYCQAWRDERDFLYDPGLHGLDLETIRKRYEPYLENLSSRDDLNYLFEEMLGEITIGHMFVGGGDTPEPKRVKGGLLGADYALENGRYRFARIYNGENWNPKLRAPLTQPGVNVVPGEYLLAVNGRDLTAKDNLYSHFEETAGKAVVLRVGPDPRGAGARDVTVVPLEDEFALRNLAWIEGNRRKVDELSGGRVAYVYLPSTYVGGYGNFNRYYFAQVGKDAVVIDERFNSGGKIADYVIDYLRRPLLSYWTLREGQDITSPIEAIFGPKVMIINEMAGSGGDMLPWMFRQSGLGPLVGKRTWGGLVGHYTNPDNLLDGGFVGTPNLAFYTPHATWEIENRGVPPNIEVEDDPKLARQGHDAQLEKAVEPRHGLAQKESAANPPAASLSQLPQGQSLTACRQPVLGPCSLCLQIGQTLAVLLQHVRRGFGGKVRVVELLPGLGDFTLDLLEFLGEAGRLGGGINLTFEREVEVAQGRMDGRSALWRLAGRIELKRLGLEEQLEHVRLTRRQGLGRFEDEFDFLAGGEVGFAAQVPALGDEVVLGVDSGQAALVQAIVAAEVALGRLGPGGVHDCLAALVFRHLLVIPHPVPEFLGDERQERMEQAQGMGEDEVEDGQRVGAAARGIGRRGVGGSGRWSGIGSAALGSGGLGGARENGLAGLDIPVAVPRSRKSGRESGSPR